MMRLLNKYWPQLGMISLALFAISMVGCGPLTWLSDALQILPIVGGMAAAVLTLVGALSGNPIPAAVATLISGIISKAMAGINDIEAMVKEYQANPQPTLLTSIEEGTRAVIDNLAAFLQDTGVTNPAVAGKITAILQLVLNELLAFQSLLPALKATHGATFTVVVPMTSKEAKAAFNAIISTATGDPVVDAALAHLKRM